MQYNSTYVSQITAFFVLPINVSFIAHCLANPTSTTGSTEPTSSQQAEEGQWQVISRRSHGSRGWFPRFSSFQPKLSGALVSPVDNQLFPSRAVHGSTRITETSEDRDTTIDVG